MRTAIDIEQAAQAVTGRSVSLFSSAMAARTDALEALYRDARVLVTGGAGFIAGQTIRTILPFRPRRLVVADTNENALAELVRDLRTSAAISPATQLHARLVDVGSPLLHRLVADDGPFDIVLAFAAAKHVRSERDPVSALHMLNINVNGTAAAVDAVAGQNPDAQIFVVSTDKAADPASLMGASKRLMELAVFARHPGATTARFANVAFSAGSLLESWLIRLSRGQILPVPAQTERYFVTPGESGQLCALASGAPPGAIVVPDHTAIHPTELEDALARLLALLDLRPEPYTGAHPEQAVAAGDGRYPILVTPRDTPGEKQTEVFCGQGEHLQPWQTNLLSVSSPTLAAAAARDFGSWVAASIADPVPGPSLADIAARMSEVIPNMQHVAGVGSLDDRI